MKSKKELSQEQFETLISILKNRFAKHLKRHPQLNWSEVQAKLEAYQQGSNTQKAKVWSLHQMEDSGGEPDVVTSRSPSGVYTFYDCSAESPKGRRSVCYDDEALESRKKYKPAHSAVGMASDMGIEMLDEDQYRDLQQYGPFDTKTSSWVHTPSDIRALGGAIFCDHRYGKVFMYHNGAESYYGARGFRGRLEV